MKYMCKLNGKEYEVEVERIDDFTPLTIAHTPAVPTQPAAPKAEAAPAPASKPVPKAEAAPAPKAAPAASGAGEQVKAPMPGTVLNINASVGQMVNAGDVLMTIEAMKMENELVASVSGKVTEILVKKGDTIDTDDVLAVIQ